MDLSQAEAVIDVINSESEYALQSSISQLKGNIKNKINDIRNKIIYHTAFIETALDDPEHISVDGYGDTLKRVAEEITEELEALIRSADNGRVMKRRNQYCHSRKPNAGKIIPSECSLRTRTGHSHRYRRNDKRYSGRTDQAGELSLNVIDTAGIRRTDDVVEKIGVDRALEYAQNADLIIYVADASKELDENDEKIMRLIQDKNTIILLNKSDLDTVISAEQMKERAGNIPVISVSAKEEQGIREFEDKIKEMFFKGRHFI